MNRERPYGTWQSPISTQMVAARQVWLEESQLHAGIARWIEVRPAEEGRYVVVGSDGSSEPRDLIPEGFSARTKVHEYGGGSYWTHGDVLFFTNFQDQRIYRIDEGGEPAAITQETDGRYRYADGRVTPDGATVICVRERHEADDVTNELIALPADGSGAAAVVVGGRDFFSSPRISPDGSQLAWLAWDLPWMPWDGCELWTADLQEGGSIQDARLVAGAMDHEAIFQPEWSPSGDLHFVSDRTGWWNLYRQDGSEARALHPMEAEFGWPQWVFGEASYGFLPDGRIACVYGQGGVQHVGLLDPGSGELVDLDLPYTAIGRPSMSVEGDRILFVGASPTLLASVVQLDFSTRAVEVLRTGSDLRIDTGYLSVPRAIEFPTEGGLTAHAHFYPPANRDFTGPPGEAPPLIVMSHGGPTSEATAELDLQSQFFTSRGFGVVDVNYGGSTGYGREFRRRLIGNWGVVDTADCINAAKYLVARGEADGSRLLIRGGSAGGYTTLCALTFHDDFAAGASYYGISDLEPFATGQTHKFERRYEHTLVGPFPEAIEVYRARSPIHFVDRISCPMILLQGDQDEVVPPSQAEVMVAALKDKGLPYSYLLFEGEQHGFRKSGNIATALEAEISFYAQILGFELASGIPKIQIENLVSR